MNRPTTAPKATPKTYPLPHPPLLAGEAALLIGKHEVQQLAADVQDATFALQALRRMLRDMATGQPAPTQFHRGLAVLLEGPTARLDLAFDAVVEMAKVLGVEGVPTQP